jgi:hypothetical protein
MESLNVDREERRMRTLGRRKSSTKSSNDCKPASESRRAYYPLLLPARLAKIPIKSASYAKLYSLWRNFVALGFRDIPGPFSVV